MGGGGRFGGWGGGLYYPGYAYSAYQNNQVYFDGVNYWIWNGMQWIVLPASWRRGMPWLGKSALTVAGCLGCADTAVAMQNAQQNPAGRYADESCDCEDDESVNQNPAYHYGRWGAGGLQANQLYTPSAGIWLPAISNQLMSPPADVTTWVVWTGGPTGQLHHAGMGISQLVYVLSSRSGGPTSMEVLVTQEVVAQPVQPAASSWSSAPGTGPRGGSQAFGHPRVRGSQSNPGHAVGDQWWEYSASTPGWISSVAGTNGWSFAPSCDIRYIKRLQQPTENPIQIHISALHNGTWYNCNFTAPSNTSNAFAPGNWTFESAVAQPSYPGGGQALQHGQDFMQEQHSVEFQMPSYGASRVMGY